ncbi:MAG: hypothetical protein NTX33_04820 [Propionibacteriales bacterium]|nr:hypothetical protein [Propionibacteriales bacterium]
MTTTYTLTGDLSDLLGSDAVAVVATLGTNLGDVGLIDLDANTVRLPERAAIPLDENLGFSITLIATNSSGTNIVDESLRYIVNVDYIDGLGSRRSWDSGYFELTANTDLADAAGEDLALPAIPALQAAAIDAATAENIDDEDSLTRIALDALYTGGGGGGSTAWADITGKPATFPPTLPIAQSDVTNLVSDLAGKQTADADLTAIASLTTTAYGRALLTMADAAAALSAIGAQTADADLTAIAALATTSYGRALLELADQAALMALLASASTTVEGKVELATDAEAITGTDAARALTVAAWRAGLKATNRGSRVLKSGTYYGPPAGTHNTTTVTQNSTTGQLFVVPHAITIDRIACEVTTAAASTTVRLAIWNVDSNDEPSTLVLDAGTVASDTTGAKEITISQSLAPGTYLATGTLQGGTGVSLRGSSTSDPIIGQSIPNGANAINGYSTTGHTGALPGTFGTVSRALLAPRIHVRIA